MRVRETITGPAELQHKWYMRRASGIISTTTTTTVSGDLKRIEDVPTPRFSSLKKCGEILPLNPVIITTQQRVNSPIIGKITQIPGASWWREGELQPMGNIPWSAWASGLDKPWFMEPGVIPVPDPAVIAAVEMSALAKLSEKRWDILTLLAEMDATLSLIFGYMKLFLSRAEKMRQFKEFRRDPIGFMAGRWLEWRFGFRPILIDIESAVRTVKLLLKELNLLYFGRAFQREADTVVVQTGVELSHAHHSTWWERKLEFTREYRGFAVGQFEGPAHRLVSLNPFVTGYELIKFSFVIDWFIDIGGWLHAMSSWVGGDVRARSCSVKEQLKVGTESGFTADGATSPAGSIITTQNGFAGLISSTYHRWPVSGPPPFPNFAGFNIGAFRWADLLALIASTYRSVERISKDSYRR